MEDVKSAERLFLLRRLHEAVKQCQLQFGAKNELATEADSRVSLLCSAWENVLQHGLKRSSRGISALKQLTEVTGLRRIRSCLMEDLRNSEPEPSFWNVVKELLSGHELQRYSILHHINTDAGRARAWLRASLNERTLERSIHRLTAASDHLLVYYEDWAYLRDAEKSATLSNMAAGLGSILFAISIDRAVLNSTNASADLVLSRTPSKPINVVSASDDQCPAAARSLGSSSLERQRDRQKKRKPAKIVSFDADDAVTNPPSSSVTSRSNFTGKSGCKQETERRITSSSDLANLSAIDQKTKCTNGYEHFGREDCTFHPPLDCDVNPVWDSSAESTNGSRTELCSVETSHSDVRVTSTPHTAHANHAEGNHLSDCNLDDMEYCLPTRPATSADEASLGSNTSNASSSSNLLSGQTLVDVNDSQSVLQPIGTDGLPVSLDAVSLCDTTSESYGSYESHDLLGYGELMHGASLAVAEVQQALNNSRGLWVSNIDHESHEPNSSSMSNLHDSLSAAELKEAIVAMMLRKEEVEEHNKHLQNDLGNMRSLVEGLRSEIDELKQSHAAQLDKYLDKNRSLSRENELLKHQLKKYVSAVQLLRHQGASADDLQGIHIDALQPIIPPRAPAIDFSQEALEYEKKLVQVAEMHGELIEFNELLQKQLLAREAQLRHLTDELVAVRGPLSSSVARVEDELISLGWDSDSASLASTERPLINIWIPAAFLRGSQLEGYHVYQIYVRIRNEEWNTYRRYAEFYEFHSKLKKRNPIFSTFDFPPKKAFGKKDPKIVEIRRQRLQLYLRHVIAQLSRDMTSLSLSPCRQTLINTVPFFSDVAPSDRGRHRSRHSHTSRALNTDSRIPSTSGPVTHHYMGL